MADDELFWPSLYSRLAPTRYRRPEEVDAEEEAHAREDDESGSFGLSRFFVDFDTLRRHVETELQSLLNATCLEASLLGEALRGGPADEVRREDYPFERHRGVRNSIVNYGLPAFVGRSAQGLPRAAIEERLRDAVRAFEPRIRPETMRVRVVTDKSDKVKLDNPLEFQIEGEILGADHGLRLVINTIWDPEKIRTGVSKIDIGR